ncbi:enoyl-CoA hydratase/isomerase family protein [Chelatococcus sp. YT9]|uniref:enoyl-CoA hydratase/isomerase family protein n=1 Tax=Chelatococcus sp. YT9 TaxID=2835635 RepID=UPI001BCA9AB9|nr:enoyl-CoA hydratase/isomerase family protein [Chelatococcus sp. YT9]MBS7698869.1 enoyl-CoA hydratase/isomerase family protein [Chelatococcus sp. YT9]
MNDATPSPSALVGFDQRNGIAVLTLNRPERRNALGTETMRALAQALDVAESDQAVGAIVLTGAAPAFCAGSDLKELGRLSVDGMRRHEAETAAIARRIGVLSKPVIAAVEGFALGGGFILAASCDVVVTAENARWHLPEVPNGWLPPWGLGALVARIGPTKARLLTWGAEPIDGTEALRLGVADFSAPAGEALARATALAEKFAALPREAVASTKRFFEPFATLDGERLDHLAGHMFAADCAGPPAKATLQRFVVKS